MPPDTEAIVLLLHGVTETLFIKLFFFFPGAARIPVTDVLQQILSRVSLGNLLNAGADNYAALVCPAAGRWPAETGDAPERFRSY